jgi:hypothetical protein
LRTQVIQATGFDESIRTLLAKVDCRQAVIDSEREKIYGLRYEAYLKEGALPPGAPRIFKDKFDDLENGATFGLYVEGRLASSIRIHLATPQFPDCPAMAVFPDYLRPILDTGSIILDPTRFVVDAQCAQLFPKLPYATVRLCFMASDYFCVDYALATVRTEHQSFYKRLFGHRVICVARPYPSLTKPISLMILDFGKERRRIIERYPFFTYSQEECSNVLGSIPLNTKIKQLS